MDPSLVSPTALERVALYFGALRTRPALLARAELGAEAPEDGALAVRLGAELTGALRPDGSVGGAAMPTIWRAHELLDLGQSLDDPALSRVIGWLIERQDAPGAYGEGCDKARHAQRICQHYVRGFFSPGPASERLAPLTLPNGKAFRAEPAARFALSCLGLRAVLRAERQARPPVTRHLDSLRLLAAGWTDWTGFFAPDVIVAGLHALALGGPEYRSEVDRLVDLVADRQRLDGLWLGADLFPTVEALQAAGTPVARATVRRAIPALEERQRADGSFGATAQQERALIALRALKWAAGG
jgi:hypothetical protein